MDQPEKISGRVANNRGGIRWPRLYDLLIGAMTRGRERAYRRRVLDLVAVGPGSRVLDIGCGTGTQAIEAWRRAQPGGAITGVDISTPMLAAARRKARRAQAGIEFRQAPASALPFDDCCFDIATMTTVLHMIEPAERHRALAEAHRVLRPGGTLLLVDYAGAVERRSGFVARHGVHGSFDLNEFVAPLAAVGFAETEAGELGVLSLHYLKAIRDRQPGEA